MTKTPLILRPAPYFDVPPPPPTPTNEALIARIGEGDGDALLMLFRRHADFMRGVIARTIADEEVCEDVVREVFEAIRDRALHYTPECGRALGWMMTHARRCAQDRARLIPAPREQTVTSTVRRAGALRLANAKSTSHLRHVTA